jgi:hypothetical protein
MELFFPLIGVFAVTVATVAATFMHCALHGAVLQNKLTTTPTSPYPSHESLKMGY